MKTGKPSLSQQSLEAFCRPLTSTPDPYSIEFSNNRFVFLTQCNSKNICDIIKFTKNDGLLFGNVFLNNSYNKLSVIYENDYLNAVKSKLLSITNDFWGRYIAIINIRDNIYVLRDPTGALDCYFFETDDYICVFSDANAAKRLVRDKIHINWMHLENYLLFPGKTFQTPPLANIKKLQAGSCLCISYNHVCIKKYFDYGELYTRQRTKTASEAAELLRWSLTLSIRGWLKIYNRPILLLSGGFDSSVVLACMKGEISPENIMCLNYNAGNNESDERNFARMAAGSFKSILFEHEETFTSSNYSDAFDYIYNAEPKLIIEPLTRSKVQRSFADSFGADCLFNGTGGDSVFGASANFCATDYLFDNQFNIGFFRAAHAEARANRSNMWTTVVQAAIYNLANKHPQRTTIADANLKKARQELFPGCRRTEITELVAPPCFNLATSIPPGKRCHIEEISTEVWTPAPCRPQDRLEAVYPIMSQPILTAACRIPTYQLILGGAPRGLARQAFSDLMPKPIIQRTSKGGVPKNMDEQFYKNQHILREAFLDGLLVKNGLLDRKAVECALNSEFGGGPLMRSLLQISFSYEAWARHWIK